MENVLIRLIDSSALWGAIGVIIGGLLNIWGQSFLSSKKNKQEVFGKLFGIKHILKQHYVSRFEAFIFSDYYDQKNKISPKELYFDEAVRWMKKSEDFVDSICRSEADLKEIGAAILMNFSLSKEQVTIVKKLLDHKIPFIKLRPIDIEDVSQLDQWKEKAVNEIKQMVEDIFNPAFEEVSAILEGKF